MLVDNFEPSFADEALGLCTFLTGPKKVATRLAEILFQVSELLETFVRRRFPL